jgi:protein-S-isoprenylcysteine O-methyltransferase Ste14
VSNLDRLAALTLVAFALTEFVLRRGETARSVTPGPMDRATSLQIVSSYIACVALLVAAPLAPWPRLAPGLRALALVIAIAGLALRWWSMAELGRFYTRTLVTADDQTVVKSGPYRLIRHPGYLGSLLTWVGASLVLAPPTAAALIAIILLFAYVRRIRNEEIMLLDRLGQAYTTYSLGTWRLLPLIY